MELTHEDVLEILETIEAADVEYLELEIGGTRIVADKSGRSVRTMEVGSTGTPTAPETPVPQPIAPAAAQPAAPAAAQPAVPATASPPAAPTQAESEALVTVEAPVVGVFYLAPEPGADHFVAVGDQVTEDTTVGLVEVMKVFNSVTAGVRGEVVEIIAANEEFVEYKQPLLRIRPEQPR